MILVELVKQKQNTKILKTILIVFFGTILLTISAKIKIPFYPVPMTMQTFAVILIGIIYGWKLGLATIFAYLLEGALGFPVFAGTPRKGYWHCLYDWSYWRLPFRFFSCSFYSRFFKSSKKYFF